MIELTNGGIVLPMRKRLMSITNFLIIHNMKGTEILEQARKQLKEFIVYETKQIYLLLHNNEAPDFEDEEEWCIGFDELSNSTKIKIHVEVVCSDDLDTIAERQTLDEIRIGLDDNLFFTTEEDDDEIHYGEIRVDELAGIANYLEEKYYKILNKK